MKKVYGICAAVMLAAVWLRWLRAGVCRMWYRLHLFVGNPDGKWRVV